jgi:hypothetical protein
VFPESVEYTEKYLQVALRSVGMTFSRSEQATVVKLGNTYLKLYGELLDVLLTNAQSDTAKRDCIEGELTQ